MYIDFDTNKCGKQSKLCTNKSKNIYLGCLIICLRYRFFFLVLHMYELVLDPFAIMMGVNFTHIDEMLYNIFAAEKIKRERERERGNGR